MISTNLFRFLKPMRRSTKLRILEYRGNVLPLQVWVSTSPKGVEFVCMPKCVFFAGKILSGGFNFFQFSFRIPGEMIYFDEHIFVRWVVQPPTRIGDRREISTFLIGGKHQLGLDDKEGVRSRHLCSNGFCSTLYASMPSFLWGYTDIYSAYIGSTKHTTQYQPKKWIVDRAWCSCPAMTLLLRIWMLWHFLNPKNDCLFSPGTSLLWKLDDTTHTMLLLHRVPGHAQSKTK